MHHRHPFWPAAATLRQVFWMTAAALGLSLVVNHFSPQGIALVGRWDTAQGVVSAAAKQDVVVVDREINDLTAAKRLFDAGRALFVDARPADDYTEAHVQGAVSLPVGAFDDAIGDFLERVAPETPLVVYCSGRTCEDSHRLAQMLTDFGYGDVKVMVDGLPGWQAKGYPVE